MLNETSLDTLCGALAYAMGIDSPDRAAPANETLCRYIDEAFSGHKADRVFMYNPDAIALWLYQNYTHLFTDAMVCSQLAIPMLSVMPSGTEKASLSVFVWRVMS